MFRAPLEGSTRSCWGRRSQRTRQQYRIKWDFTNW